MKRKLFPKKKIRLPLAPTPRPGDEVIWYVDAQRATGEYLGHGIQAQPIVRNAFGTSTRLKSFDCLRINAPESRIAPNWHYLSENCLTSPLPIEGERLDMLLQQQIPPGPTYLELIEEIWHRGYEVYVVGGTIRDVVSGDQSNDVDIVTTMPLPKFDLLLKSMFKTGVSISEVNGYARLGGKGNKGDPFIDLKLFCLGGTGTSDALFGADFIQDIGFRDFACNAIYYDPMNRVFIDPSGRGLKDAESRILSLVCKPSCRSRASLGQVAIRYFKFHMRGYRGDPTSDKLLKSDFIPCISAMTKSERLGYVNRQILGKIEKEKHTEAIKSLEDVMRSTGYDNVWDSLFQTIIGSSGVL